MRCQVCAKEQKNPVCGRCRKRTDLVVMKLNRDLVDPVMKFWGAGDVRDLIRNLLRVELGKIKLSKKIESKELDKGEHL